VWADPALSPRDRSIATVAAVIALYRPEELPAQLHHLRVGDRCTDTDPIWYVICAVHKAQNNQLLFP
jgi:hypothetical protein